MEESQEKLLKFLYKQYNDINDSHKFIKNVLKDTIEGILQCASNESDIDKSMLSKNVIEEKLIENNIEEKVLKMYASGRTIEEIEEYLNIIYGEKVSNILVDRMMEKIVRLQFKSMNIYPKVFLEDNNKNKSNKNAKNK